MKRYRCQVLHCMDDALLTIHYLDAPNEEAAEFAAREFAKREFELPITGLWAKVEEVTEE